MIKYFCDRCGKETSYANGYTIPPMMKNENGVMHHGGFFICNECYHRWCEVKDRVSDIDFVKMSDKELQPYRCDFKVGDKVITKKGRCGYITDICACDRCKERGFFEPTVSFENGDTDYIMITDRENGFKSYYQIGKHVFGNLCDESVIVKEIDEIVERYRQLIHQQAIIRHFKNGGNIDEI